MSEKHPDYLWGRVHAIRGKAAWIEPNQPEVAEELYRLAIRLNRQRLADEGHEQDTFHQSWHATLVADLGYSLLARKPEEAEKLLDEAIQIHKQIVAEYPYHANLRSWLVTALRGRSQWFRRRAKGEAEKQGPEWVARRLAAAEADFQEALGAQRHQVQHFGLVDDRHLLVQLLQEEAIHLLQSTGPVTDATRIQSDALLTEAIQLCRQLVAEFPANATYSDRLEELLKLQAQHFGQKGEDEQ